MNLVQQIWNYFEGTYGFEIGSSEDLFEAQRDLLEFFIGSGRDLEQSLFEETGTEYRGRLVKKGW